MAVRHLDRVAGLRRHGLDARTGNAAVGGRREDKTVPQPVEKVGPEHAGLERVQGSLHSHRRPSLDFQQRLLRKFFKNARHGGSPDLLAQLEKIFPPLSAVPDRLIAAAFPSPDALAAAEVVDLELAPVVAAGIGDAHLLRIVHAVGDRAGDSPEGAFTPFLDGHLFLETNGRPEGAEHLPVLRQDQTPPQHLFEGGHHSLVEGRSAQEHDTPADPPLSHDPVEIVVNNGITETADEVLPQHALLVVGYEIRLHEHRAALRQLHGPLRGQGDVLKFADDVDSMLVGQLMEKTPGAGGADLVHVEVQRVRIGDGNVFGILAPDFEDRIDGAVDLHGSAGVGRDLVEDQVRVQEVAHHISSGARGRDSADRHAIPQSFADPLQQRLRHLDGFPPGGEITLVDQLPVFGDDGILRSRGADVDPQIDGRLPAGERRGQAVVFGETGLPEFELWRGGHFFPVRNGSAFQRLQVQSILQPAFQRAERDAERSRRGAVGRYQEVREIGPEGPRLQFIEGQTADEEQRALQRPVGDDRAHVVPGISDVKAIDDVLQPFPFVLEVNHVRLGEHRATAGYRSRFGAGEAEADEVPQDPINPIRGDALSGRVNRGGQSLGLLIDEGTGPGRAGTVGVEVFQLPSRRVVTDLEKRGVLTSHADDGPRVRSQEERARHLADGFEFVEGPRPFADRPAVISRKGEGRDMLLPQPFAKIPNQTAGFFLHPPHVPRVGRLVGDALVPADDHRVETDRSRVDSHVIAFALHRSPRSLPAAAEDECGPLPPSCGKPSALPRFHDDGDCFVL
ncbi:MAG: hypothetical protein A4E73_01811 [Syntrophaceae bacterium PtaU1.Bin231]|nr:MAG: hypothetical protein A4E73_01811 [Syntrophaceae bacterium PtaU1.Bin231]